MASQAAWDALEDRYRTPPARETPTTRGRRQANRRTARSRLQRRQVTRRLDDQQEQVAAGTLSQIHVTQAEREVFARRYASPAVPETAIQRRRRLANRSHGKRRLLQRMEARRTARRALVTANRSQPPATTVVVDVSAPNDVVPVDTNSTPTGATEASYAQLTAAVLNLASSQPPAAEETDGYPTMQHLPPELLPRQADPATIPTYAQLTEALRSLTPEVAEGEVPEPNHPTYAQLNAALRNLSPGIPSQEYPLPGFPTYAQLADALRNLTPSPTSAVVTESSGFPTYAQLTAALRALPSEEPPNRRTRAPPVRRNAAVATLAEFVPATRHLLPEMNVRCPHCGAMRWRLEKPNICCLEGRVVLAPAALPPPRIQQLYNTPAFLDKIRGYNSAFAFTSTGAKEDYAINRGNAPYTFRINGAMHHRIGHLLPPEGAAPAFAQIYMYDGSTEEQVAIRGRSITSGLDLTIVGELQAIINAINPLAAVYKSVRRFANASQEKCLVLLDNPRVDPRRYNRPTANEVAAIIVHGEATASHRDIVLRYQHGGLRRIYETHPLFDPLQYPLIYLRGEIGWSTHAQYVDGVERHNNTKVSLREHTTYRLHIKHEDVEYSLLHRAGRLMQQWCVDQAAKIIDQRLFYQRGLNNQRKYRRDLFSGLQDLMVTDHVLMHTVPDLRDTGTHVILSPSFQGGVRYMRQQYYNAMAITASDRPDIVARVFRLKFEAILTDITKKHVFGVVQAYVYVIEFQKRGLPHAHLLAILEELSKPRTSADYDKYVCAEIPDREAFPELFETVSTCMIHGPCGDGINSACIGNDGKCSKRFPKAFEDATRVDGEGYPVYRRRRRGPVDPAAPQGPRIATSVRIVSKKIHNPRPNGPKSRREAVEVDNRWVVPYNPYLCQKYNCHINVEICSTVQSVKYLYKYVYKGQDRATVAVRAQRNRAGDRGGNDNGEEEPIDEIQQYLDARYLSPPEACWTIFKFRMQQKSHHVHQLTVHDENQQMVHYPLNARLRDVIEYNRFTMLTAFFELCGMESPQGLAARVLLYHEMPLHFVWEKVGERRYWLPRSAGGDKAIGRMISVSPRDTNRYYIRLLLCYRRGPTSFTDLRTVEGVVYETFKGAALAMGLLESDEENHRCLIEATSFEMPKQLRHLFAVLLVYCDPTSPQELWSSHLPALCEDHLRDEVEAHNAKARSENRHGDVIVDAGSLDNGGPVYRRAVYRTLQDINSHLISNGQSLVTYVESLPQFSAYRDVETNEDRVVRSRNNLIVNETSYETAALDRQMETLDMLNADQRHVYERVMEAVNPEGSDPSKPHLSGKQFFLDGPGGTGKSFLLETILASVRRSGRIALAVAGSGIAAQLLTGGRTAHSAFRLPLDPNETSTCNFGVRSSEADLLTKTSLIVWDEAPMTHRYQYEAVDRTLQDLLKNDMPFGGITVLMSGDFRQTLPVIPRAGPAEIISASLKRSPLWVNFECLRLTINMRVRTARDPSAARDVQEFADYLLRIGDGRHEVASALGPEFVEIPVDMLLDLSSLDVAAAEGGPARHSTTEKLSLLIEAVYSDFNEGNQPDSYFADRIILTPKNSDVLAINDMILDKLPGEAQEYLSVDSVDGEDELQRQEQGELYPTEFLNTISLSGMPPHKLRLKVGTPVMLIRNLNTKEGLCNGTRLRIIELRRNCMKAAIMSGALAGKEVAIPRVALISKNSGFPFELRRKQFPVQVAFAMTINKSQGQSIQRLGLFLPEPVFSHGQFYVAVSRVTARSNITVLADDPAFVDDRVYTKNIVYREIVV